MGYDLISCLPDELLFHIISSIPFESAIQTIFLSKRWKLLWQTTLECHGTKEEVPSSMFNFLADFNEHDPNKSTRKFKCHFGNGNVLAAVICPRKKLQLDSSAGIEQESTLDRNFGLELEFNHPKLIENQPTSSSFIVSLDLLSLNSVSAEAVSSVISSFSALEALKITACNGLESLSIGSDTKLQSLTVFDCPRLKSLNIRSFKLKTFRYRGLLPRIRIEFMYHFNLDECLLDSRQGPGNSTLTSRDFDPFLLTIKNVKVLTLCRWIFEGLILPSLTIFASEFQFYYLKELWWVDESSNRGYHGGDAFIPFLKLCPSLEKLYVTVEPTSFRLKSTAKCSIQAGKNTRLANLKLVQMEGFGREEDMILVAESIGEVATSEPLVLTSSDGIYWRQLVKVPSEQSKWNCVLARKYSYEFIDMPDMNVSSPVHSHMVL